MQNAYVRAEETFKGVVDLVTMKACIWNDETMGSDYSVEEIPANLVAEAEEWRDKMLETISEFDDALMEKYFDDPSTITEDEIRAAIRKGCLSMQIFPMVCGSSFKNKGVQTMLDAVCAYLPSPLDTPVIDGTDPATGDAITRTPDESEPLCALAFKIATDPYVGRLCFFRVYSGKLDAGSYVYNPRSGKRERISRIFQMHSNRCGCTVCISWDIAYAYANYHTFVSNKHYVIIIAYRSYSAKLACFAVAEHVTSHALSSAAVSGKAFKITTFTITFFSSCKK